MSALLNPGIGGSNIRDLFAGEDGTIYVRVVSGTRESDPLLRLGSRDSVENLLPPPKLWFPVDRHSPYEPSNWWGMLPDGREIVVRSDHVGFLILDRLNRGQLQWAEVRMDAADFLPEERKEHQAVLDWFKRYAPMDAPSTSDRIPARKPFSGGFLLSASGEIWIKRRVKGIRNPRPVPHSDNPLMVPEVSFREPLVYEGFLQNGTYLGSVSFPADVEVVSFRDDVAWGIRSNEEGAQSLVKFRLASAKHDL